MATNHSKAGFSTVETTRPGDSTERTHAPLRVAIFSDSLPERNGTGAYYHDLASQLGPRLNALEIFQPLPRKNDHPFPSLPMPGDPMQRLVTPNVFRIRREFHALNPHIVISVTPGPFGMLGLILARRRDLPFITGFHTDFEALARIYFNRFSRHVAGNYLRLSNQILCRRSRTVLVNNSQLIPMVKKLGCESVDLMGTPLQPAFTDTPTTPPAGKVRQICFAGRLAPEKNVDQIIEAAPRFPDIRFVICGEGPLRKSLTKQAHSRSNIEFKGWVKRSELIHILDESSFLLLPSKLETFGSIALEAMARGRPALVSANAGIHDWPLLESGLFTLQPESSLGDEIGQLLTEPPSFWVRKAEDARAAALALNDRTIEQWVSMLQRQAAES
jgi:glycosyltransferase involved in cell wall biosynthesis